MVAGIAAGYLLAPRLEVDRYLDPSDRIAVWMPPVMLAAVAVIVATALWSSKRPATRSSVTVAIGLAAAGVFLCVPETGVLRFVVPPILLAGMAVVVGMVRPLTAPAVAVVGGGLAWLALIDGHARGSAVVGAAASLAVVGLVPLIERARVPSEPSPAGRIDSLGSARREILVGYAILAIAVVACSRWAGLQPSTVVAFAQAVVVLAATAAILRLLRRPASRALGASRG